jgi:hypothetical protein
MSIDLHITSTLGVPLTTQAEPITTSKAPDTVARLPGGRTAGSLGN